MKVTVTEKLKEELDRLNPGNNPFWERLSDITEHPPKWLRDQFEQTNCGEVKLVVVPDDWDYGQVTL